MKTYTTVLGDMFDKIALEQLGSEYLFPLLLKENPQHRTTLVFSAGVVLNIPDIVEMAQYDNLPAWFEDEAEVNENVEVFHGIDA